MDSVVSVLYVNFFNVNTRSNILHGRTTSLLKRNQVRGKLMMSPALLIKISVNSTQHSLHWTYSVELYLINLEKYAYSRCLHTAIVDRETTNSEIKSFHEIRGSAYGIPLTPTAFARCLDIIFNHMWISRII